MEELQLTDPVVAPEQVTTKYRLTSLTLSLDAVLPGASGPGVVAVALVSNLGAPLHHQYIGQPAVDMIKWLNTANFTTKSLHKRILERLTADGVLSGTVVGAPDP